QYLSFKDARQNRMPIDWDHFKPVVPAFTGIKIFDNHPAEEIAAYIDWQPFFIAWELHGKFPQILTDPIIGVEATKLYKDAQSLLKKIIAEKWLKPRGVVGIWPASAIAPDTVVVKQERGDVKLEFLRQQIKKAPGQYNMSLADFIKPGTSGSPPDYIGAFTVTIQGIEKHIAAFEKDQDDYNKIILQALADRLAEAFAEWLHAKVRKELWGYAKEERLSNDQLIGEEYSGIRPAPGYPACPDHTEKIKLFDLLGGKETTGITLTESLAMYPASSVSGWYFAHPESKYFGVGKIEKDQVIDYAQRKAMSLEDIEKWLRPVLEYET
ncbi:MAG TPA: vitamin B12 dependent-methionine synthase activation domain-containing protein, partial [Puia sp.]|nr:vitamin B12 dependent-methionine synthase activation domain-containing protein [Puia sp.]